jgi:hypothetical protein
MMNKLNPFSQIKASDFTDDQINSLWVEFGQVAIDAVIEPRSKISKYILGGKGSGKTHLLRYYSYPVSRLRYKSDSGLSILAKQKFLAVFLRASGVDAARFDSVTDFSKWQTVFGIYLELRLVEEVLEALYDIKKSSVDSAFDDIGFVREVSKNISDNSVSNCQNIEEFLSWVVSTRREIDNAVNNAAFSEKLEVTIPFNIGSIALNIGKAIAIWHESLANLPLIYLIDEIENFSESQQEVVNTFIRYGEGLATFRVTGRLYSVKTLSTMGSGEKNREGAEFITTILDDKLRNYKEYPAFAKEFIAKHLWSVNELKGPISDAIAHFDPKRCFEEINSNGFYGSAISKLKFDEPHPSFINHFISALQGTKNQLSEDIDAQQICDTLTRDIPELLKKLNLLVFCKKFNKKDSAQVLAENIRAECLQYMESNGASKGSYANAYGHYSGDLFAQLCREAKNNIRLPYAGFDTFVKMSAGNPRNLLIVLGRAYQIASFKEVDFLHDGTLSIQLQTEAALQAAMFAYEQDASYGILPERARIAAGRLASVLRTARYALKIPEVSPLAVSFSDDDLTPISKKTLESAIHFSFLFDIKSGRPDRNSERLNRKIQLNPMMAPKWGLPLGRRGDLPLNPAILNAIFDHEKSSEFDSLLKALDRKWNNPFKSVSKKPPQRELF